MCSAPRAARREGRVELDGSTKRLEARRQGSREGSSSTTRRAEQRLNEPQADGAIRRFALRGSAVREPPTGTRLTRATSWPGMPPALPQDGDAAAAFPLNKAKNRSSAFRFLPASCVPAHAGEEGRGAVGLEGAWVAIHARPEG
jgi:hypothetical protein